MNDPPDYMTFEVQRHEDRLVSTINAMVAPTVEDAAKLANE